MKSIVLRTLISFFFIGLLFYFMRDDIPQIVQTLKNADRKMMLAAVVVFLATVPLLGRRLQLIFAAEDVRLPLRESCSLTFVGYFFNNFLPTAVGGDIVKAMCAARITGQPMKSATSVLLDRIFGLFTFIIIPSFSFIFMSKQIDNRWVPVIIYSFLVVSICFFILIFNRGIARRFKFIESGLRRVRLDVKVRGVYDGLHQFKNHKAVVAQAMVLSIVGQSVSIVTLYLMARALGVNVNIIYFFMLVPVVHLISMVPSLNGLGIREGAYVAFLKGQMGAQNALALGILWLALLFLLSIVGGIIYLVRQDYHIRFTKAAVSKAGA